MYKPPSLLISLMPAFNFYSSNMPHPKSHVEVVPPTGNFLQSLKKRPLLLLARSPPLQSPLYVLHLDGGGVYVYLPLPRSLSLPVAAFLAFRRLIQCCCKKTDISRNAAQWRGAARSEGGGRLEWAHYRVWCQASFVMAYVRFLRTTLNESTECEALVTSKYECIKVISKASLFYNWICPLCCQLMREILFLGARKMRRSHASKKRSRQTAEGREGGWMLPHSTAERAREERETQKCHVRNTFGSNKKLTERVIFHIGK